MNICFDNKNRYFSWRHKRFSAKMTTMDASTHGELTFCLIYTNRLYCTAVSFATCPYGSTRSIPQIHKIVASGTIRMIPVPEENLIAIALLAPPKLDYSIDMVVGGTKRNIAHLGIFKKAVGEGLAESMIEPRRKMLALHLGNFDTGTVCHGGSLQLSMHSLSGPGFDNGSAVTLAVHVGEVCSRLCAASSLTLNCSL